MKYNEFEVDDTFFTNEVTLTKEEIKEFAEKYDPQYLHMDEESAKQSRYGSLIASGFQTLAVIWGEFIRMDILGEDCLGGLGAERIRWKAPVFPNDRLSGEFTIQNKKETSDKTRGILSLEITIRNQHGQTVLTGKPEVFVKT
ncbi:MaoC/PaaZ C-terminal domain-containing protein [Virgibacillus ainsalahensis]